MMRSCAPGYNERVIGFWGRGAASALFVSLCFLFLAGPARADESYSVGPSPIVRVLMSTGKLTIATSDSPQVTVSTSGAIDVQHLGPNDPGAQFPPDILIPPQSVQAEQGMITLMRENFVLPHLPAGPHDAIVVRGQGDTTITIPRNTALVFAHVRAGRITIQNYNGIFVAHSRVGGIFLQHVGGTGFAQSLRGSVNADDSTFARLRVRTGTGNMLFRNCVAHQIEASSTYGSIVYDNGQFQPGLARFESQYGNVAVGVQNQGNGVQIGAHSGSGHIVSNYSDGTQVTGGDSDTEARVRGGGPVVTTSSQTGSVYLYNGSMAAHPAVQQNLDASIGGTAPAAAAQRPVIGAPRLQQGGYQGSAAAGTRVQQQPARVQPQPVRVAPGHYPAPYQRPLPPRKLRPVPAPTPTRKHPPYL
jgi:Putative adhesin